MDRASSFSRAPRRQLLIHAATLVFLSAAATVHATSDALSIAGYVPYGAIAGRAYEYTPTVSNPSGRALTFGIVNKPSWATFNTRTGQLSGTPPNVITIYQNVSISVTDGVVTVRQPASHIRVYPPTSWDGPVIGGTPATSVKAGSPYAFQPSARDVYNQPLSFSVKNKPAWASFSIATGSLSGTPTSAEDGTYSNIEITVSNGQHASTLRAFNITVTNGVASTGSATLNWTPPTENTNGSALTDLAGVRIYYGTSASNLSQVAEVTGGGQSSYTVGSLTTGTWYFAASAYATDGTQSERTSVISKSVQ